MPLRYPPIQDNTLIKTGRFTNSWVRFFDAIWRILSGNAPVQLASYTVLTLPNVEPAGQLIYVSNATGGSIPAFSDGVDWRRVDTRAIIT